MAKLKIKILTTGGTIDKVYFDRNNTYEVGEQQIGEVLARSDVVFDYEVHTLCHKDSLELTDDDRRMIHDAISRDECRHFIVTHGTDTMAKTAETLRDVPEKVIVLTGASQPARFYNSNAIFNIGGAIAAVQTLPAGVYIVMNGRVFEAGKVRKNLETRKFEDL